MDMEIEPIIFDPDTIVAIVAAVIKDRKHRLNWVSIDDLSNYSYKIKESVNEKLGIDIHIEIERDDVVKSIKTWGNGLGIYTDGLIIITNGDTTGDAIINRIVSDKVLKKPILLGVFIESIDSLIDSLHNTYTTSK